VRLVAIAIISLLLVLVLLVGGGVLWLMNADFRSLAERKGSEALGRTLTIGALQIGWDDPLSLEIKNLRIANAPWGSQPDMISIDRIYALIEVRPLLHGVIRYQRLDVTRPVVLLERDKAGTGNWKFGNGSAAPGGFAVVPKDRTQFPTLLDLTLHDATITYRTTSGKALVTALEQAAVHADDDDQPVTVTAKGSYNDLPAELNATTDSFVTLRNGSAPFGENFTLGNKDSTITFKGHLMDPLDFDQIEAALTIETNNFGRFLKAFDAGMPADFPAKLSGSFTHDDNHWQLDAIKGEMAKNPVTGKFVLDEGPRGGTDKMAITARYDTLDLETMLGKREASSKGTDYKSIALDLPDKTAPEIKADIAANRLRYGKTALSKVALVGTMAPGRVALDTVKFVLAGTPFQANGTAEPAGKATRLRISAGLPGANLGDLLKTLDAATDQISGEVSSRIELDATGAKLGDALAHANGFAVVVLHDGKVSRDLVEQASIDLRTFFRKGKGMSVVHCLLGVAQIKNGIATVSPLFLRTPDATLTGGGTVDLLKNTLDLRIKSDPKSTGFFALDIPVRISGALDAPSAKPMGKSDFKRNLTLPDLPKSIRQVAETSGCLGQR